MRITILSRSENIHANAVEEYCSKHVSVDRINFDFDTFSPEKLPLITIGRHIARRPDSVFIHHPRVSYRGEWFKDETERKLFVASWDSVKEWMEAQFPEARWVNRPSANRRNRNILGQLKVAEFLGLETPPTLFTNDINELRTFADTDTVVIKQGNLGVHMPKKRILTSVVDTASIDSSMLRGSPCLFQKYVSKQFELRIHVIGDTVLACRIDSQASGKTRVDWRDYDIENTPHQFCVLDGAISGKCVTLVRNLGLEFGVIDMIVTPQDGYVFLECNAHGHWIWIEKLTGLPITKTLCEFLLYGSE